MIDVASEQRCVVVVADAFVIVLGLQMLYIYIYIYICWFPFHRCIEWTRVAIRGDVEATS